MHKELQLHRYYLIIFIKKEESEAFKGLKTGNRIATWLSYVSFI
jgi:hypothetical protein